MFSICWRLKDEHRRKEKRVSSESNDELGNELGTEGRCELNETKLTILLSAKESNLIAPREQAYSARSLVRLV